MSDETKDAREDVLTDILHGWDPLEPPPYPKEVVEMLARIDRADPLRAMLPDVVDVLERARPPGWVGSHVTAIIVKARDWLRDRDSLLCRLRTLTPTCGNCGGRGIVAACSDPTGEDPEAVWWDTHCADCSTLTPTEGGTDQ